MEIAAVCDLLLFCLACELSSTKPKEYFGGDLDLDKGNFV